MGFDLDTPTWKIHFSNYTDEIAKRYAFECSKEKYDLIIELSNALKSIRGIEAWIQDDKMKTFFQKNVYSAIEKVDIL